MTSPFVLILATGLELDTQIALKFAPHYPIAFLCDAQHNVDHLVKAVEEAGGEIAVFETNLSATEQLSASISTITSHFGSRCAAAIFQLRNEPTAAAGFLDQAAVDFREKAVLPIKNAYAFSRLTVPLLVNHADGAYPPTLMFAGTAGDSYSDEINDGALVALSRSLGREFGKKGVHVCHVKYKGLGVSSNSQDPESIAETYWHLHTQPLSCFSNEITI
ncbi:uncharacterized protein APUU_70882S [Aspergillus puulaauensis]|uniref:Oxidoreductase n=1 Tax=Aspergillus puulaauensis TaxID=1220207 RepID=A0A7R7XXJ7_9EURO|nr:uncharacterized protein APUU_70882S [Aspergillus puulaauensis]BCS29312.1 hypothetical protein APUU_70882S [Aspergillus puulaauensis]